MKSVFWELVRKSAVYGLGSSLNALVGFVLLPFIVRRLYPVEYGRYALAEMVLNFQFVLLGLGMNIALLARYPRLSVEERGPFLSSVFGFVLLTTGAGAAVFLLAAVLAGPLLFPGLSLTQFVLAVAIAAAETIMLFFVTLYRAEGAAWRFIFVAALQSVLALVLTLVLIMRFGYRENGLLYGRLIADAVVLVMLLPEYRRYWPTFNLRPGIGLLKLGLPLVPATFASMCVAMSPRFLLERLSGVDAVGAFAIHSKIAGIVSLLFVQPFGMSWMAIMPRIARREDAKRIYAQVITYYVLVGGAAALAVGFLAPQVIHLLGRQNFAISPAVVLLLCGANVAGGLMYPVTIGPYICEKTGRMVPVFLCSMVLSTVGGWVFVKAGGLTGAATELLVVNLIQGLFLGYVSNGLYPIEIEWSRIARVLAVLAAAYWCTRSVLGSSGAWWSPGLLLGVLTVGALFGGLLPVRRLRLGRIWS